MNIAGQLKHFPAFLGGGRSPTSAAAIVLCPGGGYGHLAVREGEPVAQWLAHMGIHAFVLAYRHTSANPHPAPLEDVLAAISHVRRLTDLVDVKRVGVMGFSAGGHLAASAAVHGRAEQRPDVAVLGYPVISMEEGVTHGGSRLNLLGPNPDAALVQHTSCDLQVTAQTPPCFIFHAADDEPVPVENALRMASALSKHKVPFELLVMQSGGHGFDLAVGDPVVNQWTGRCAEWLRRQRFIG